KEHAVGIESDACQHSDSPGQLSLVHKGIADPPPERRLALLSGPKEVEVFHLGGAMPPHRYMFREEDLDGIVGSMWQSDPQVRLCVLLRHRQSQSIRSLQRCEREDCREKRRRDHSDSLSHRISAFANRAST